MRFTAGLPDPAASPVKRRLIVSADDLGLHEAINTGVVAAHEEGIVTAASMVACGRAFEDACRLVRNRPQLDLGIHLTLIEEKPLLSPSELKTLAPRGRLPATYRHLFLGLMRRRIDLNEVEKELGAQIQKVLDAGLAVSHLDSHQHAHFFPPLRPVLFRLAERHQIRGLRAGARVRPRGTKFSLLLGPLARSLQAVARARDRSGSWRGVGCWAMCGCSAPE